MKELLSLGSEEHTAIIYVENTKTNPKLYLKIFNNTGTAITSLKEYQNKFWTKPYARNQFIIDLSKYKIATLQQKEEVFKQIEKAWEYYKQNDLQPKTKDELLEIIKNGTDLREFHPAMTFGKTKAYFGAVINTEEEFKTKPVNVIIDSDGDFFELSDVELHKRRFSLLEGAEIMKDRWSRNGVQDFINGKSYDFNKIYAKIYDLLKKYMDFSQEELYHLITLWIIGTYTHQVFYTYPYLLFEGYKASGKTKILNLISLMAFNGMHSGNMSPSQLFRQVQGKRCTLLLDETEKLMDKQAAPEFRNLLLNGYKKGGYIYRTGDSKTGFKAERFEIYGPKALGNIAGVEDVLGSRCINIIMLKAAKGDPRASTEPREQDPVWQEVRDGLFAFGLLAWRPIQKKYDEFHSEQVTKLMSGRDIELWKPVFSLCQYFDSIDLKGEFVSRDSRVSSGTGGNTDDFFSRGLYESLHKWAVTLVVEKDTETAIEELKHKMMRIIAIQTKGDEWIKLQDIVNWLKSGVEECPEYIKSKWVSKSLKKFGFHKKRTVMGYTEVLIDGCNLDKVKNSYVEELPTYNEETISTGAEGEENAKLEKNKKNLVNASLCSTNSTTSTSVGVGQKSQNDTPQPTPVSNGTGGKTYTTRQLIIEYLELNDKPTPFNEILTHIELLSGPNKKEETHTTLHALSSEGTIFQPKIDQWCLLN